MTDSPAADSLPDCNVVQTDPYKRAYCAGHVPGTTERARMDSALTRMRTRGAACTQLADAAAALLNLGRFRLFPIRQDFTFSGAAPTNGSWAILAQGWTTYGMNPTPEHRNLDGVIAHEMDHHLGNHPPNADSGGHLAPDSYGVRRTMNETACDGI